ncbi:MAG: right-handed parallel beta-helix repeat-containing protein [Bdellovibrionales bacterium]|nr:right-handed parallel beta-helix repeat-containing protein [Bdellovibrionales bacterium]
MRNAVHQNVVLACALVFLSACQDRLEGASTVARFARALEDQASPALAPPPRISVTTAEEFMAAAQDYMGIRVRIGIDASIRLETGLELYLGQDLSFGPAGFIEFAQGASLVVRSVIDADHDRNLFGFADGGQVLGTAFGPLSVKWFGAQGDGMSNDTTAFQRISALINSSGGGTLVIPGGVYVIGRQSLTGALKKSASYKGEHVITLTGNRSETMIMGDPQGGTVLKFADGMRFGTFDPVTGAPYEHDMPFFDHDYLASPKSAIFLKDNGNVVVRDLEIDGNLQNYVVGGKFGDVGWQIVAHGIHAYGNGSLEVESVHTHHHGTDGIVIGYPGLTEHDPPHPHRLDNVVSEYNGRQGLSWVGGNQLVVTRSKFNHTGRARTHSGLRIASSPGAGLDIEAETSICRGGVFEDSEFADNYGPGIVADSGNGGYTTFRNIDVWGTTNWSLWLRKPGIVIEDSRIRGSAVNFYSSAENPELAVKVYRTLFEDSEYEGLPTHKGGFLVEANAVFGGLLFEACQFVARTQRLAWFTSAEPGDFSAYTLRNSVFSHANSASPNKDYLGVFRGGTMDHVSFESDVSTAPVNGWYLSTQPSPRRISVNVLGPHIKWANWSWGTAGLLPDAP